MSDERGKDFGGEGETASFSSGNKLIKKKKKVSSSIDRLSELPEALLIHILSYLGTDKAAAAAVLSKRWRYLWTELPDLDFCESDPEKARELVARVHRALVHRTANYLEGFDVHFAYEECFESDVSVWVEFAVRNNVKHFSLEHHSCSPDFYVLPQALFSCSSLTEVSLQGCILLPKKTVNWHNLTSFDIEGMELDEDAIQKILSGCPVLRSLRLTGCWGFERLDIESPSLHHLMIEDSEEDDLTSELLEISAPYIRVLSISPFLHGSKKYRITNTPSLIAADIHFDMPLRGISEEEIIDTMEFFEEIKHVKKLTLGYRCIGVLCKLVEGGRELPESTRECLTVEAMRNEDSISGIVALLESSPKLETLVIQCFDPYYEDEDDVGTWGPVFRGDLACDLLNLKTVTLRNFADPYLSGEPMLTMAQILLKRATALEKMTVDPLFLTDPTSLVEISRALRSYPRMSQKAVVVLSQ